MTVYTDSRGGVRQTPTRFPYREADPQVGVILFPEPRFVHAAAHHIKEFPYQASLRPAPAQAVVHPPTIPPRFNQTDSAETAEVSRDLILRHPQSVHQLADAQFPPTEKPEEAQSHRIAQTSQDVQDLPHRQPPYMHAGAYDISERHPRQINATGCS